MSGEKKGLGCRAYIGMFFVAMAAIFVGVLVFAPEKLPPGIGFNAVPIEITVKQGIRDQGNTAIVKNPTKKTIHNVTLTVVEGMDEEKEYFEIKMQPDAKVELGKEKDWDWGDKGRIEVSASGYRTKTITYKSGSK